MIKTAVLTISDSGSRGERKDISGPAVKELLAKIDAEIVRYRILPDDEDIITKTLMDLAPICDLIVTTGGTGVAPRDITPEATLAIAERVLPGFGELMRRKSYEITPNAIISRAQAVVYSHTLIINLPGSPKAARENFEVILPAIPHTIEKIKGSTEPCGESEK